MDREQAWPGLLQLIFSAATARDGGSFAVYGWQRGTLQPVDLQIHDDGISDPGCG